MVDCMGVFSIIEIRVVPPSNIIRVGIWVISILCWIQEVSNFATYEVGSSYKIEHELVI